MALILGVALILIAEEFGSVEPAHEFPAIAIGALALGALGFCGSRLQQRTGVRRVALSTLLGLGPVPGITRLLTTF